MISKIPFKLIKIKNGGYHLHQFIKINGKQARLIIDTGASATILDKGSIQKFTQNKLNKHTDQATGISGKKMDSFIVSVDSVSFGSISLKKQKLGALDLSNVNATYKQLNIPHVDGVLGSDLLKKLNAVVDYSKKEVVFNSSIKKTSTSKK
ncbi:MAG: clan AA aspartic protease [Bacteroidetes bacterium]|nr:clan AA aspartic protease [Bacteroidota bacterium]